MSESYTFMESQTWMQNLLIMACALLYVAVFRARQGLRNKAMVNCAVFLMVVSALPCILPFRVIDEVALPVAFGLMYGAMVFDHHGSNTSSTGKRWLVAFAIGAFLTLPLWIGLRKHYAYTPSKLTLTDDSLLVTYGRGVTSLQREKLRILEGSDHASTWRLKDGVHNLPLDCEDTFNGPVNVTVSGLQIARRLEKWSGRSIEQSLPPPNRTSTSASLSR